HNMRQMIIRNQRRRVTHLTKDVMSCTCMEQIQRDRTPGLSLRTFQGKSCKVLTNSWNTIGDIHTMTRVLTYMTNMRLRHHANFRRQTTLRIGKWERGFTNNKG